MRAGFIGAFIAAWMILGSLGQAQPVSKGCPAPPKARNADEALKMEQSSNHPGCWVRNPKTGKLEFIGHSPTDYKGILRNNPLLGGALPGIEDLPRIGQGSLVGTWIVQSTGGDPPQGFGSCGGMTLNDFPEIRQAKLIAPSDSLVNYKCDGCRSSSPIAWVDGADPGRFPVKPVAPGIYEGRVSEKGDYANVAVMRLVVMGDQLEGVAVLSQPHQRQTRPAANGECFRQHITGTRLLPKTPLK